jgi:phosphoglycerate dehydrogenase-like enzyme
MVAEATMPLGTPLGARGIAPERKSGYVFPPMQDIRPLTIWCNFFFPEPVFTALREQISTRGHQLLLSPNLQKSNLIASGSDPLLPQADVALGQPEPEQTLTLLNRLRWVHLTSAGYTRYDRPDIRQAFQQSAKVRPVANPHGQPMHAMMTNSSQVYAEPCAEHLLAMILALARRLPQSMADQLGPQSWRVAEHRAECRLLLGQRVLILGLGAIGTRLVELLQPFKMHITAVRRRPGVHELCEVVSTGMTDELLPQADHIVNVLPANPATDRFLDRRRIGLMKPTAVVYNIGRGTTVDQPALLEALQNRRIAAAYLDVTDPEPVPPGDPLWTAPNCFITPHTAGGHVDEFARLARHFVENLDRYVKGEELVDRVI